LASKKGQHEHQRGNRRQKPVHLSVQAGRIEVGIRKLISQFKLLPQWQSDGPGEVEFGDGKVIARNAQVVFFRVQLNFSAREIDSGSSAGLDPSTA
jgi:hypothetical protein